MLFIIFGLKRREKSHGKVMPFECGNCDNLVHHHLHKTRSWFHIFWFPLIPWFANRYLLCETCGMGYELSRGQAKRAKSLHKQLVEAERQDRDPLSDYWAHAESFAYDVGIIAPEPMSGGESESLQAEDSAELEKSEAV